MSERRPGIDVELVYDPENYDGGVIPEALVDDLIDWCSERKLFGTFKCVEYDENGGKK